MTGGHVGNLGNYTSISTIYGLPTTRRTTNDECMHLLDPATCTICNGREKRQRVTQSWSDPFHARYDSRCIRCDERINEGDLICFNGDIAVHEECAG
jgi:hypothetical protein